MTRIEQLDVAIKDVCPIHGVSIGRWNDRSTWRIDFKDEATDEQRTAALSVVQVFDADAPDVKRDRLDELTAALVAKGVLSESDVADVKA